MNISGLRAIFSGIADSVDSTAREGLFNAFSTAGKKWLANQAKNNADTAASEALLETYARNIVRAANDNDLNSINGILGRIEGAMPADAAAAMGFGRGSKAGKEAASARGGVAKAASKEKKTAANRSAAAKKRESAKRGKKIVETKGEPVVKKKAPTRKPAEPKNPFEPDATAEDVANWKQESVQENVRNATKTGGKRKRRTKSEVSKDELRRQNRERTASAALEQESMRRAAAGNPMTKAEENDYYKSVMKRSEEAKQKRKDTGAARPARKVVKEKKSTPGAKTGGHYEDYVKAEMGRGRDEVTAVKNVLRAAEMSLAKKKQLGKSTAAVEEQVKSLKARLKKLGG